MQFTRIPEITLQPPRLIASHRHRFVVFSPDPWRGLSASFRLGLSEGTIVTWRTEETIPVDFGTIQIVPVWRFLLDLPQS
ncbi:hypothetical protein [Desulfatirhabdium butyrativorans]|uniref:hypothetical protein n=1 Tax=Desulfatirhabdium butyrativorans TaxID=340467 RepID=UPI000410FDD3|nr:hypothetical protein [Desulfatirhabdium butyrativorans]